MTGAAAAPRGEPPDGGYAWVILGTHAVNAVRELGPHNSREEEHPEKAVY